MVVGVKKIKSFSILSALMVYFESGRPVGYTSWKSWYYTHQLTWLAQYLTRHP